MGGLDMSRLSSASAKDASRSPDPNRDGNNRRTARTSSRPDRRPGELCGIEGRIGVASAL